MTPEEQKLVTSLKHMAVEEANTLNQDTLYTYIGQLLKIIAKLDLRVVVKPVGPERVLRVESSLPPDPTIVVERKKDVGRAHD